MATITSSMCRPRCSTQPWSSLERMKWLLTQPRIIMWDNLGPTDHRAFVYLTWSEDQSWDSAQLSGCVPFLRQHCCLVYIRMAKHPFCVLIHDTYANLCVPILQTMSRMSPSELRHTWNSFPSVNNLQKSAVNQKSLQVWFYKMIHATCSDGNSSYFKRSGSFGLLQLWLLIFIINSLSGKKSLKSSSQYIYFYAFWRSMTDWNGASIACIHRQIYAQHCPRLLVLCAPLSSLLCLLSDTTSEDEIKWGSWWFIIEKHHRDIGTKAWSCCERGLQLTQKPKPKRALRNTSSTKHNKNSLTLHPPRVLS